MERGPKLAEALQDHRIVLRNRVYYTVGAPADDCIVGLEGEEQIIEEWLTKRELINVNS